MREYHENEDQRQVTDCLNFLKVSKYRSTEQGYASKSYVMWAAGGGGGGWC